jgi:hypothetical protein
MTIVYNEDGLRQFKGPCVVQQFINHSAVLLKVVFFFSIASCFQVNLRAQVFVVGEDLFTEVRPSIRNQIAGPQKSVLFDSHTVSKSGSSTELNEVLSLSLPSFLPHLPSSPPSFLPHLPSSPCFPSQHCISLSQVGAHRRPPLYDMDALVAMTSRLRAALGLKLFGFDGETVLFLLFVVDLVWEWGEDGFFNRV